MDGRSRGLVGDVARVGNGSTPSRKNEAYWKGGTIPWITSKSVHEVFIRNAGEFVTDLAKRECHLPTVPRSSIVVAITGQGKTLGNAAIVELDTCINQHLAYIDVQDAQVVPEYLLAFMRTRYKDLRQVAMSGGSTKGALTCGFLKTYVIPKPSVEEQTEIAAAIGSLDAREASARKRAAFWGELFKSTLHELMTGRIRTTALIDRKSQRAK